MASKLDKVMGAECQLGVKYTNRALAHLQALARLQVLTLDAIRHLTDLLEKLAACGNPFEDSLDLQVVEDAVQSAIVLLGNASTQFSVYRRTMVLTKT